MYKSNDCRISGISVCVPKTKINNKSFLKFKGKKEFIKHTGVNKHYLDLKRKISTSDLCLVSANKIIKKLNWKKKDIGFLIFVSQTRDFVLPNTACVLQKKLGLRKDILAYDIPLGCSGFVFGLYTSFLISKNMKTKGLLLLGDMSTKFIDLNDPKMLGLFGDAGTAVAVEYKKKLQKTSFFSFGKDGEGFKNLIYNTDGMRVQKNKKYLEMNGAKIFEFALKEIPEQIKKLLEKSKNKFNSIDYFVFHQANKFLLETLMKKLKIPNQKIIYSIDEYGNTNSASIPITIFKNLKHKKNIKILACGFGIGYSWASAIINLHNINYPPLSKI